MKSYKDRKVNKIMKESGFIVLFISMIIGSLAAALGHTGIATLIIVLAIVAVYFIDNYKDKKRRKEYNERKK